MRLHVSHALVLVAALAIYPACGPGGEGGSDVDREVALGDTVLRVERFEAGEFDCPDGGVRIEAGVDDDEDGRLSTFEVESEAVLCDGDPGRDGIAGRDGQPGTDGDSALIVVSTLPSGGECEHGGVLVEAGVDRDGDGTLAPDETTDTALVCDGAPGVAALVEIDPLAPDPNVCPGGGFVVSSGLDVDGDGELDEAEITDTEARCDPAPPMGALAGSVVVRNQADLDALTGWSRVSGDVIVEASGIGALEWPMLTRIDGALQVVAVDGLTRLTLPDLESIGAVEIRDNPTLATLELPAWLTLDGTGTITGNEMLPECSVADLAAQLTTGSLMHSGNATACP